MAENIRGMEVRVSPPSQRRVVSAQPTVWLSAGMKENARKNFREAFCCMFNVAPVHFERELLRQSLFRRARFLAPLLRLVAKDFFAPDMQLIRGIAHVRDAASLNEALDDFLHDRRNRRWARSGLKLRISTRRLLDIADILMPEIGHAAAMPKGTFHPFN